MIGTDRTTRCNQLLREVFDALATGCINDPCTRRSLNELRDLLGSVVAGGDRITDVRSVESGLDQALLGNAELLENVGAGDFVGCRSQREPGHMLELIEHRAQCAVIGTEIVSPFRNAVGFIDGKERNVGCCEE